MTAAKLRKNEASVRSTALTAAPAPIAPRRAVAVINRAGLRRSLVCRRILRQLAGDAEMGVRQAVAVTA
jgi:hypothetical protein